ncbi:thiamine-monophosphate kinase [Methylobacterium sp. 4-46]|uniref:thiamine-phosphate kinase n=1 Tax=unclassified Methylobacterium TaxID=2615210 RepID=UPI000165CDB8|nr:MULTISPECIES: thiamine-phosphate kinase [Methylobacterium]ACA21047.1 thiamine-monophosphate kinase [Methylobacterium sp. 4-46]WFT80197.1 thiamine-phosphate kinase [Methylobacterium nodulans]
MTPRPSEDALIARYFAPLAGPGGLGLRDDAAELAPSPGHDLVLTTDAVVAGVHYFPDDPPASIAVKALGVNLSDLAAKGARPRGFLLTLALAESWTEAWLAAFCAGLGATAQRWGCPLLGGDTVRAAGPTLIGVTALGEVPAGRMVRRFAAKPGDRLLVSGTIGDAALGLRLRAEPAWAGALSAAERDHLADRYLHPRPRLPLAPALLAHAGAAMDVSDGLVGDLAKMLRASGAGAEVDLAAIPLSPAARAALAAEPGLREAALTGGDDYELLCAVPPARLGAIRAEAEAAGIPLTPIGTVTEGPAPPRFRDRDGSDRIFAGGSFSHF